MHAAWPKAPVCSVWPQAEVVRQLTSIGPGPSVVLPLSTAEVWVACCYGLAAAIPGSRDQQQPPSRWRLYKLRAEGAGTLLPCALRPCWEGSAAGADSGSHVQRSSSAVAAGGSRAASPPGLHYRLLALASTPFPAAAEPAQAGEQQQQQQEQQQHELVVAEVVLTPGGHALEAARAHRLPGAGEAVAACLALCKQQGQRSAQLAVATRAGQVCLLPLPAWLAAGWGLGGSEATSTGTDGQADYHHSGSNSGGRRSELHACSSSAVAQLPAPANQLYFLPAVGRQPGEPTVRPQCWRAGLALTLNGALHRAHCSASNDFFVSIGSRCSPLAQASCWPSAAVVTMRVAAAASKSSACLGWRQWAGWSGSMCRTA